MGVLVDDGFVKDTTGGKAHAGGDVGVYSGFVKGGAGVEARAGGVVDSPRVDTYNGGGNACAVGVNLSQLGNTCDDSGNVLTVGSVSSLWHTARVGGGHNGALYGGRETE